ncbi:alpha/beta hydrolase [Deinococcus phoenicis]|uniref:Alpha/beta hydrolase n=1 Tax=Deinococcus phoenicis TaxID=1476583 RepID=A0A016QMU1_9DEIO|nr:alpha/beta hydrolase [Deinococcus phoenicis]EYB67202.1 alpha/beta hydrolase [Deinococcus phoenicis]
MPLDPKVKATLDQQAALPPLHALPVEVVRQGIAASLHLMPTSDAPVAQVENRTIPGPAGELPIRVYTPQGQGPFPLVVYFHGGGWTICTLDTHDPICRELCAGAGAVVVSVDYRLAPEHPFPAAPDDCFAATRWVAEHAAELGGEPERIAVAGDSAGGNLAAVVALRARDEGGPALRGQLLIYPSTDLLGETASRRENGQGYGLTTEDMHWFRGHYLADEAHAAHPHASPSQAENLSNLPPALVITAEYDPLRDEGEDYARALQAAGVDTRFTRYDGMHHGFFGGVGVYDQTRTALDEANAWLRGVLR